MAKKVLLVEDDAKIGEVLKKFLEKNEYEVLWAMNGEDGLKKFYSNNDIDISLLDVSLPGIDGFQVLKEIREDCDMPVIMLTARDSEEEQLRGLTRGADLYITKPFIMSVLLVQMNKLLDREIKNSSRLVKGALTLERNFFKAYLDGEEITLTPKEFDLLVYMAENEKMVLDRERIIENVWGYDYQGDYRTVDTLIKQIRKKMTEQYPYITSVYGKGYKFEVKND